MSKRMTDEEKLRKAAQKIPAKLKRKATKKKKDTEVVLEGVLQTDISWDNWDAKVAERKALAKAEKEPKTKTPVVKPTIQQAIRAQVGDLIAELDEELDKYVESGMKKSYKFNMYNWLRFRGVKGPQTKGVLEYYAPHVDEINSKDEQVKEGFAWMTSRQFTNYRNFLISMVEDIETWAANLKTTRKKRVARPKSAEKQVAKLNYMKSMDEYKLVSVASELIVGASSLWVFNTKTRMLGVYNAVDRGGFKVKGSTLLCYEDGAEMKKVRKPLETLPEVLQGGKIKLRKMMDSIKAKPKKMTGRINKYCVLLKVVK